ncbi:hypothetical protein [Moorena sp. SIO3H5]|uniref:hypothetical protein n=1 Tax=Moorena sp. SIO3H5 TaxID=2607834 RepID=UPI0013B9CE76|nr:hypothetical protein [Moorena sp. SIO3H5]NEO72436.1 hypothetical protein [Moorena sp. SIO3H5]
MPVPRKMPIPPRCPFHLTLKIIPLLSNANNDIAILFPMRYKAMQRGLGGSPHERLHQERIPLNPP